MKKPDNEAGTGFGGALADATVWVGRSVAAAYRAVDPDLRTHLAQLPLVGLTLFAGGDPEPGLLAADGHRPVVLVHGLGGGPGNFFPMRAWFRLHGRTRTLAPPLVQGLPLPDLALGLAAYIEAVAEANGLAPERSIDLIAHSMGGLVARLAMEDDRVRARVSTLVTLGTPHSGSHLARYGAMATSLALRPDSDVIARLARQVPWQGPPSWPRLVAFWSPADVLLLPATSARVDGAENVEVAGFTHYSYLISPSAWRMVLASL